MSRERHMRILPNPSPQVRSRCPFPRSGRWSVLPKDTQEAAQDSYCGRQLPGLLPPSHSRSTHKASPGAPSRSDVRRFAQKLGRDRAEES